MTTPGATSHNKAGITNVITASPSLQSHDLSKPYWKLMSHYPTENWEPPQRHPRCYWWHRRLSRRQPPVPPATTKPASPMLSRHLPVLSYAIYSTTMHICESLGHRTLRATTTPTMPPLMASCQQPPMSPAAAEPAPPMLSRHLSLISDAAYPASLYSHTWKFILCSSSRVLEKSQSVYHPLYNTVRGVVLGNNI